MNADYKPVYKNGMSLESVRIHNSIHNYTGGSGDNVNDNMTWTSVKLMKQRIHPIQRARGISQLEQSIY